MIFGVSDMALDPTEIAIRLGASAHWPIGGKDFSRYYDLEDYLFQEVSGRFRRDKRLSAFDFFCIVIWKANRAKSKVASRLLAQGHPDLEQAVLALTSSISNAEDSKERLRIVLERWGFRLPMASAILTVLYPNEFTVYDVRVCEVLKGFGGLQFKVSFDSIWSGYSEYLARVQATGPQAMTLREKDKHLWGQSFSDQLERDIISGFGNRVENSEFDV